MDDDQHSYELAEIIAADLCEWFIVSELLPHEKDAYALSTLANAYKTFYKMMIANDN